MKQSADYSWKMEIASLPSVARNDFERFFSSLSSLRPQDQHHEENAGDHRPDEYDRGGRII
ncbi:MAG: hypothetical protein WBM17_11080, partial [Anaerolineales bacterium]